MFGNSDEFLLTLDLGAEPIEDEEQRAQLLETARWSQDQLGESGLEFLRGFEATVELDLDGSKLVCCHATPGSNEDVILPATPSDEAERMLGAVDAAAVAAGHVHLQWLRRFAPTLWFCVGSVGLVYEQRQPPDPVPLLPWSEHAIVSDELEVSFRRIPFDVEQLIDAARKSDFPDLDRWAAMWQR